ncbi:helix-turn-helix domain-containing protein [Streptomyces sp. JJ66]|uniref:helix-turn-helix transcriptional regulator n=1 Tax=Streptomyces sp. JJ66 TaxID=2803843 RepID=UPI0027E2D5C1|nr:helix-turn-helix domain-containing protein [Streptomyces sp. JJ66]
MPPAASGAHAAVDEQHGTRNRVARSILDHGPSTAAELAERLALTQAAVRRHLDALVADGMVEARAQRVYGHRGRGRPAKVFALTGSGRDAFDQAYDELAVDALRWIAQAAGGGARGQEAVAAFARARVAAQTERYRERLAQAAPRDRTRVLAEALSEDGYAATARSAPASPGEQLCQHHCPVAHAAERFPQLCEAETEVFSRLLGTHVQRLATLAHGDGVCTTFVPKAPPGAGEDADHTGHPGHLGNAEHAARADHAAHADNTATAHASPTASASTAGRNPA